MDILNYYQEIQKSSKSIFDKSLSLHKKDLGKAHYNISFFSEFADLVSDISEREMIKNFATQLEFANISLVNGLYRQAFTSIRLAFELALATIYFSTNKLELSEWKMGLIDIRWSKISDSDNGVISKRFCQAFFPEMDCIIEDINESSIKLYRELSEFVHGNSHTWNEVVNKLEYKDELVVKYFGWFNLVSEIISILLCLRYLKSNEINLTSSLSSFIENELKHIVAIREYLGGANEDNYE